MRAEIITIGDEILIGQIIESNSTWIASQLDAIGIKTSQFTTISDRREHILSTFAEVEKRADLILITGGLGPTNDDLTKGLLCEYFNTELVFSETVFADVKSMLDKRGIAMNELNRGQALVPKQCTVIRNYNGTAPGLWFDKNSKVFVAMPGVPFEMKAMMETEILPKLKVRFKTPVIYHKTILTMGLPESILAERIAGWESELHSEIKLAYLPSPGIVRLRLSTTGEDKVQLKRIVDTEVEKLSTILPNEIYGFDTDTIEAAVGRMLKEKGMTVSTAESCTGGKIASLITSIPGSSAYYKGSVIAYSNEVKENVLKVSRGSIEKYGAVSKQVVEEMARGVTKVLKTDFAMATSGIAGPEGGSPEKPVGTTWIAVSSGDSVISEKFMLGDHRERNITKASLFALNMLRKMIGGKRQPCLPAGR